MEIENRVYHDGGTGANNPIRQVYNAARECWPERDGRQFEDTIQCLVSIGTGKPNLSLFKENVLGITKTLVRMATDCENIADDFEKDKRALLDTTSTKPIRYFRFNVDRGLATDVAVDEYNKYDQMVEATNRYLDNQAVLYSLNMCGKTLQL